MTIEATIQRLTNDGEILVQFLVDTVQGNTNHATVSHRLKSTEWLAKFGGFISETDITPPTAPKRAKSKSKPDKLDKKSQVTEKQILNYEIARLIKQETRNGESIIEFLVRVVLNGENFTAAARMRAVKELLFRGFGSTYSYSRRALSGSTENLGSEFSKLIRECANLGARSVTFLIEAMENKTPGGASKGFTSSQRVWAACELMRRAYDIRTDHITPEDIQAYRNAQPQTPVDADTADTNASAEKPADNSVNAAAATEKPANSNGAPRASRRRQQRADHKAQTRANHSAENPAGNADRTDDVTTENPGNADASAKNRAETPGNAVANTEKIVENPVSAPAATENPAYTNGASRAARRRQQRADRKAQKRSPRQSDSAPDAQTPEDFQAELDAFIAFANANDIPYFILEESEEPETAPSNAPNPANNIPDDP